jgi:hypothetical protein
LDCPELDGYTSLSRTIAGYLYKYMQETGRNTIKVCFGVSTRGKAIYPYLYGNYFKPAVYTVTNTMSIEDICKTHVQSIDKLLADTNFFNAHTSINELPVYFDNYDFYFSTIRGVCQIKRTDGVNMNLVIKQNLDDIRNIKKYNRHIIHLGYFDNKWMFGYVMNYNDTNLLEFYRNQNIAFIRTDEFVSDLLDR